LKKLDFKNYRDVIFDNNYCVEDAILNKVLKKNEKKFLATMSRVKKDIF